MLSTIRVQNFALIDSLELQLGEGLQVITGETGAGKSILLGALRLLMGERADLKAIANLEKKCVVEGEFIVPEEVKPYFEQNDIDFETPTLIRRELVGNTKSRAFINDIPVTLEVLKGLSSRLIDIHSQFDSSELFSQDFQFSLIDHWSKNTTLLEKYQSKYLKARELDKKVEEIEAQISELNKDKDYKEFLFRELEEATLNEVDWEDLQTRLSTQQNAGLISENLQSFFSRFDAEELGILDALIDARSKLSKTAELSHEFSELKQRLEANFVELKDILFELQNKAEEVEVSPEMLAALNLQSDRIQALFVKHQVSSIPELIEIREKLSGEKTGIEELETFLKDSKEELSKMSLELSELSEKLSIHRKKKAPAFAKEIQKTLARLGLEKAQLEVQFLPAKHFNLYGKEEIALLFQANAGYELKPIETAISGGERSRVMLAIKKMMAQSMELPTLILDEIDTGVSGKVAEEIGNVMREMATGMQLIIITHLAQVAAKGSDHYKVKKMEVEGKTLSTIQRLSEKERQQEIAQLLSGSQITEAALIQAQELMK